MLTRVGLFYYTVLFKILGEHLSLFLAFSALPVTLVFIESMNDGGA